MRTFWADEYQELNDDQRSKVDEWLQKYGLADSFVSLITSQGSLTEDQSQGIVREEDHVAVYSDIPVKRWIDNENFIMISNSDISYNAFTKIAEFSFDDFPWEV